MYPVIYRDSVEKKCSLMKYNMLFKILKVLLKAVILGIVNIIILQERLNLAMLREGWIYPPKNVVPH